MIIYNITITVDPDILDEWLDWMRREHIPEVLDSGIFISAVISRVISDLENEQTYAIAYTCKSMKDLKRYQKRFAIKLQKKYIEKYGEKTILFRTLLENVEIF